MKNILFCGNTKVFDGFLTAILSILMRTKSPEPFTFFFFTMDVSHLNPNYTPVSDAHISFLDEIVKSFNSENRTVKIDVTDLYMKEFCGCPNEGAYCSPYTLLRLLADEIPGIPDKILYLDADILFNKDISLLYDIDVEAVEYAAARDHYGKLILFFDRKFVNAGVVLFNMRKSRETGLFEKCRTLLKKKRLLFADESALIRSTSAQKIISQRFNDQKFLYKNTVARHFSQRLFYLPYPHIENVKQWQVEKVRKVFGYTEFDDIFDKFLELKEKFKNRLEMPN